MTTILYILAISGFIIWPLLWLEAAFLASKKKPVGNADKTSQRDRQGRCAVWRGGSLTLNQIALSKNQIIWNILL